MAHYRLVTAGITILFVLGILVLLRRQRLNTMHSIWWFAVAGGSALIGLFPGLIDTMGALFGIHYPPVLLLVVAGCLLFVKILTMDIERTRQERQIRILSQRLALYEREGCDDPADDARPRHGRNG
ncbi:MAG: DUF2304 domain-containing protein [Desulfovibrionaceae bacterium]